MAPPAPRAPQKTHLTPPKVPPEVQSITSYLLHCGCGNIILLTHARPPTEKTHTHVHTHYPLPLHTHKRSATAAPSTSIGGRLFIFPLPSVAGTIASHLLGSLLFFLLLLLGAASLIHAASLPTPFFLFLSSGHPPPFPHNLYRLFNFTSLFFSPTMIAYKLPFASSTLLVDWCWVSSSRIHPSLRFPSSSSYRLLSQSFRPLTYLLDHFVASYNSTLPHALSSSLFSTATAHPLMKHTDRRWRRKKKKKMKKGSVWGRGGGKME